MVSKDSAAQYARDRHRQHHRNFVRLANAVRGAVDGRHENWATAVHIAGEQRRTDGPFRPPRRPTAGHCPRWNAVTQLMRILHVSWEYPPIVYGGLGRHVHALAEEQARQGHDVWVLTQQPPSAPAHEVIAGVTVVRVQPVEPEVPREPQALVDWVRGLDAAMANAAREVVAASEPQVVHAHDWVVTATARAATIASGAPLVTTLHATEAGRHQGWISGPISTEIHIAEYRLAQLSQRVITCSTRMAADAAALFAVPASRIDVIPNGIDLARWTVAPEDQEAARQRWGPRGPLVVFVGRLSGRRACTPWSMPSRECRLPTCTWSSRGRAPTNRTRLPGERADRG